MTFLVRVDSNAPDVARAFRGLAEDEIPWATTIALTRTAIKARDEVREDMPRRFTLRNRRSQAGVQVKPAERRNWPLTFSVVGHRDPWFVRQETGGVKRPEKGASSVAVPTKLVKRGSQGVAKAQKPRRLRDRKDVFVADELIRQRVDRKKGLLARLQTATWWLLRREVRIEPRFHFRELVERVAKREYQGEFEQALANAVRKARIKSGAFALPSGATAGRASGPIGPTLPS